MADTPEDVMKIADAAATQILQECVYVDRTSDFPGVEYCTSEATMIIARAIMAERVATIERCASALEEWGSNQLSKQTNSVLLAAAKDLRTNLVA